jgi:hypothetical protein
LTAPFLRRTDDGITIELRVQPRARRTMLETSPTTLKAAVTAPAEDGKANEAVFALLAGEWRVPKSRFSLLKGATSRNKTIAVAGEPAELAARVEQWMKTNG